MAAIRIAAETVSLQPENVMLPGSSQGPCIFSLAGMELTEYMPVIDPGGL